MERALALARLGWGRVAPNPMVGCVLVREGVVIGEGYHQEFGGPHAEVNAVRAAGDARGATCVVTLEPCAHTGQTPPCTDALIAAGVSRVVFALPDPNPRARGGAARLRAAGIEVVAGIGRRDAALLNAAFLWQHARPDRPYVALKLATSLDGFLADAAGKSQWISGPEARAFVHWLRAGFDAIAVGRRTAEADNPQLTVRGPLAPRKPPVRIIFSLSGEVREDLELVRSASRVPTWVVTVPEREAVVAGRLSRSGVTVVAAPTLADSLRLLRARGIGALLVEGGAELASALMAADVVDRFYWIQCPIWLGSGRAGLRGGLVVALEAATRWVVAERRPLGDDTLLVVDRGVCLPAS